ncbi:MAG TPA: NAD(P)/FAD-dependent oxidoreductase [Polyangia bacterium]|nr:NAD(P)/FAD-dependent oxidoreductase [Polyangia bacterium]
MSARVDVVIAGAGPAGCATALACARRGLEVLLVDRAQFPRDKPCGEGLLPTGVAALAELGLLAAVRQGAQPLDGVGFSIDADDAPVAFSAFPDDTHAPPYGLGVRRTAFDALLVEAVRAQPTATVLEGVAAGEPLRRSDGAVVGLDTDVGPVGARAVVAADGLRSRLRQALGLSRPPPLRDVGDGGRIGLRAHLRVPMLPFGPRVRVIVGRALEYYVTPLSQTEVQLAVLGPRAAFVRAALSASTFAAHLAAHPRLGPLFFAHPPTGATEAPLIGRPLGAGPFRQRVASVITDGALLVGDAAGYVDAITGEGIGAALRQGLAAGDALAAAIAVVGRRPPAPLPAAALAGYARAHDAIVRDGDRLTELVLLLARHPRLARRAIASLARRPRMLQHLLRVHSGAPLSSVPLRDWAMLVAG